MKKYKLGWRYWILLSILLLVDLLGTKAAYMMFSNQVTYGDGESISLMLRLFICTFISVIMIVYIISTISMVRLLVVNKGCGLIITEDGIRNTIVFVYVLAFIIVLPVKHIPWNSVKYYDVNEGVPYIRVDTKQVKAGSFAKLILKILGYNFLHSFVRPNVAEDDISHYITIK